MEVPPEGLEWLELCGLESDKMLTSWECAEVLEAGFAAGEPRRPFRCPSTSPSDPPGLRVPPASL